MEPKRIKFNFHPFQFENKLHAIEKDADGKPRKYLKGVSSGLKIDGHGERMTEKAINSFMSQANGSEILLFPDAHGIRESEDIGKLVTASVTPTGDWETEFRLYDDDDGIGPVKMEKVNDVWKQVNGLPPYDRPRQKGFSIEGYIPDSAFILNEQGKRVVNDVKLDGVVLVPRPAYTDSIANAIYKALEELHPYEESKVHKAIDSKLKDVLGSHDTERQYYSKKYEVEDAFNDLVETIMKDPKPNKQQRLNLLFDEYKTIMIDLILKAGDVFGSEDVSVDKEGPEIGLSQRKVRLLKEIEKNFQRLVPVMKTKRGKK